MHNTEYSHSNSWALKQQQQEQQQEAISQKEIVFRFRIDI